LAALANGFRAGLAALFLTAPLPVAANGIAGDYLAARQASFLGDFKSAAHYYSRALAFDPGRPELLERAILSNLSLGDVPRAAVLADRLQQDGFASQIAQMATIARDARSENFGPILKAIEDKRGAGPLADGLIKAWAQLGQGDMSAAVLAFDEVAKVPGLASFSVYHKALALASVGDFDSANALFEGEGAKGMAGTRRGVIARLQILSQLDRNEAALALLDDSFGRNLDPGLERIRHALAAGQSLPFTQVGSPRDGMAEVFYTLGGALSNEGSDDLTLLYVQIAAYLREDHTDALLLAAEILSEMEQFELAVAAYERVPREDDAWHAAVLGQAEALRAQERPGEAIALLEAMTEEHDDLPALFSTLGDLYRQEERLPEATEAYTQAIGAFAEESAQQWFLYYARAITLERQDKWPEAEADFRKALELNPGQPQVLNYLGYSLVQKELKLDEALDMIERAVAARPDSGYIVDSLGWVLYRLGRYEEALPHMERAAELMPIDPIVNDHLGDVYWAVGRKREAEFMWKRALSFADMGDSSEEADVERIRRKIAVGLDVVLSEAGEPPLLRADASD
jgi:tetratricopeptide (TPR) repeat protein